MAEKYIHVWLHKGEEFLLEQTPTGNLEDAIREYYQQLNGCFQYQHTIVYDLELGTCKQIDIEDELDLIAEAEAAEAEELAFEELKYGSYQEQVTSLYNSTRI